ncbi:MAG TPA: ParB/RepB/Spo0J family partition protein [Solirubrobacteraceae bacterium]|nr:ParB/RepB/Spo0J family partition protein [Solirubrobacteraceae bacterium]
MIRRFASDDDEDGATTATQQLRELPVRLIDPNPSQPRQQFEETALHALAGSIREHGVLQPVLVRPRPGGRYQIVAGERRWSAAQIAGLEKIPALVCRYDDRATLEVALIENMARENLNVVEEARACQTLFELGLTNPQIGERVGRSPSTIANLRRLLNLSQETLQLIERGELSAAHGRALLAATDVEVREELAAKALEEQWSALALEARARESNEGPAGLDEKARAPRLSRKGGTEEQYLDEANLAAARAWGDLMGVGLYVRPLAAGRVRLEVQFNSPQAALDAATRLAEVVSGSKGPSQ